MPSRELAVPAGISDHETNDVEMTNASACWGPTPETYWSIWGLLALAGVLFGGARRKAGGRPLLRPLLLGGSACSLFLGACLFIAVWRYASWPPFLWRHFLMPWTCGSRGGSPRG